MAVIDHSSRCVHDRINAGFRPTSSSDGVRYATCTKYCVGVADGKTDALPGCDLYDPICGFPCGPDGDRTCKNCGGSLRDHEVRNAIPVVIGRQHDCADAFPILYVPAGTPITVRMNPGHRVLIVCDQPE